MDNKRCITTIDEIPVIDGSKSHCGVRRCRDTEVTSSGSGKKQKFDFRDHENVVRSENRNLNSSEDVVSSVGSATCDRVSSSSCFQNCLLLDLKTELRFGSESFMSVICGFSGTTSKSSEICLDSDKIESFSRIKKNPAPPQAVSCRPKPPATSAKLPTAAELEEFFAVAEKKEQKRFSDKYNFDIVNDVQMEGRYQWVRLKP